MSYSVHSVVGKAQRQQTLQSQENVWVNVVLQKIDYFIEFSVSWPEQWAQAESNYNFSSESEKLRMNLDCI